MEDFVTFEIAKKLREKGFREMCTHCYRNGDFTPQEMFCGLRRNTHPEWSFNSMKVKLKDTHKQVQLNIIDAPTISQVLKWLREEKKIHIGFGYSPRKKWRYVVMYMDDRFYDKPTLAVDGFLKIDIAALAGIEYVLDNLI